MQFVSYNIQYGTGRDGRVDLARIAQAVSGADVIALQEVERFSRRTGMVDQPAVLSRLLPGYHWVYGPGMDLDADGMTADGHITHQRRQFGNMLSASRASSPRATTCFQSTARCGSFRCSDPRLRASSLLPPGFRCGFILYICRIWMMAIVRRRSIICWPSTPARLRRARAGAAVTSTRA